MATLKVYDANRGQMVDVGEAVGYMTPEWLDDYNCPQTTLDLALAAKDLIEQVGYLLDENHRLKRILAHVPARVALKAKEDAGYGDHITTKHGGINGQGHAEETDRIRSVQRPSEEASASPQDGG